MAQIYKEKYSKSKRRGSISRIYAGRKIGVLWILSTSELGHGISYEDFTKLRVDVIKVVNNQTRLKRFISKVGHDQTILQLAQIVKIVSNLANIRKTITARDTQDVRLKQQLVTKTVLDTKVVDIIDIVKSTDAIDIIDRIEKLESLDDD